jgi:hypothetical protein
MTKRNLDRIYRGQILQIVSELDSGDGVNYLVLLAALKERGYPTNKAQLHLVVAWLESRGYVRHETLEPHGVNVKIDKVFLQRRGADLLAGLISDQDIALEEA